MAKIIAFRRPEDPKPAKSAKAIREEIESWYQSLVTDHLAQFAGNLATARALFREYPEMVTAPDFPAELAKAYREESNGQEAESPADYGSPVLSPAKQRELRRYARKHILARNQRNIREAL